MSNYSKGLPQNNIRYRTNKSPDAREQRSKNMKNIFDKKLSVVEEMQQMKQRREDRKKRIEEEKQHKKDLQNDPNYIPKLDYDFDYLIQQKKAEIDNVKPQPHSTSEGQKIYVCVRKRPIFNKEIQNGEIDCVSAINPKVCIYDCKLKIDGYTKYIDTNDFYFDNVFGENEDTNLLFECSVKPSLDILLKGGVVTCFAYGQTGSGKTFTMKGIQDAAIYNIFDNFAEIKKILKKNFKFYISFFEIYSGRLYDLLNNRNKVMALEDKNQKVQIYGLTEKEVFTPKDMQEIVDYANAMRTTHNTVTNETSSRSHAICNFVIKTEGKKEDEIYAKLSLVDLAGSERATETQSNNKSRLAEGAEINKSLLALKECIRALDARKTKGNSEQHIPFRNSKLTLVLRDSFLGNADLCKIIMISCISPSNHSANHTINTLRYSMRLKEKIPNASNNSNIGEVDQILNKKNNLININKNGKKSKSPNIKRNLNKNKEKFHAIENKAINRYNYSNDNINDSTEINKNNIEQKPNKIILMKNNGNNVKINRQKSPYYKNKTTNKNSPNLEKKFEKPSDDSNKKENQYSSIVNKKKKELQRAQTSSNKLNKEKVDKINDYRNNQNKKINKTMIDQMKYFPSYQGNDYQNNIYKNNYVYISNNKNIELNIDTDTDTGEGLIRDQMDVIKSQQKYLAEDEKLINKFKRLSKDSANKQIYIPVIENVIQAKMNYLNKLQDNIKEYKKLLYNYKK